MKYVLDTNILLDYCLYCRGQQEQTVEMLKLITKNNHLCFAPSNIANDFFYILERLIKKQNFDINSETRNKLTWSIFDAVNEIINFIGCDESDIFIAQKLRNEHSDLEDNLVLAATMRIGADFLITNDSELLKKQLVPTKTPKQIIDLLY